MKFAATLALLAVVSAIKLNDNDIGDLFNDDSQEADTLASIKSAEQAHGMKLGSDIANE